MSEIIASAPLEGPPRPTVFGQGRYANIDSDDYHRDICIAPSLSSHMANTLLEQSPRHAWTQHPRLNPNHKRTEKKIFDIGTVAHSLMLGDSAAKIRIVKAKNWTTKLAREQRMAARKMGFTAILEKDAERLAAMVNAGQLQLEASDARDAFTDGESEQTLVWTETTASGLIWCRARLDWYPRNPLILYDYKTTGGSAHSDSFFSSAGDYGYALQAAFYMRGVEAVSGQVPQEFRFVVQETEPPYALSINAFLPDALAEAQQDMARAIELWGWCLHNDSWPGYSRRVAYGGMTPWVSRRREARQEREQFLLAAGLDAKKSMIEWSRPL